MRFTHATPGAEARYGREASAPPPIPFPWNRAIPGFAGALALLVALIVIAVKSTSVQPPSQPMLTSAISWLSRAVQNGVVGWIAFSLLLALASVMLSLRVARRR